MTTLVSIDRDIIVANFIRNRLRSHGDETERQMLPEIEEVCERISRIQPKVGEGALVGPISLTSALTDPRSNIDDLRARYMRT